MIKNFTLTIITIISSLLSVISYSQRLLPSYTKQQLNVNPFRVIGSFHDSILVYAVQGSPTKHMVYTFDRDMNVLNSYALDLPKEVFDEAFEIHGEDVVMFYQYKKGEKHYLDYIRFTTTGQVQPPVNLLKEKDISSIYERNKLKPTNKYVIYFSDNSNYTLITRRANYEDSVSLFTFLLDQDLNTLYKLNLNIPLYENEDIDNICLDNEGTLAFLRTSPEAKRNNLCIKLRDSDAIQYFRIQPENILLSGNNLLLPDNRNNSFIFCSTYFTGDNSRGIFFVKWNKKAQAAVAISKTDFTDALLYPESKLKSTDHLFVTNIHYQGMSDYLIEGTIRPETDFPELDNFNINYYNPAKSIVVIRYDDSANVKWIRQMHSLHDDKELGIIGFNSFLSQKGVWKYIIEKELSSGIVYVSLQSINEDGKLSHEMILNDTENFINGKKFIKPLIKHGLAINDYEFIFPYMIGYGLRLGMIRW